MLMKTCTQPPGVRLHAPAHCVMCVNFLYFPNNTLAGAWLLRTVGGQLVVSPSATAYPHTRTQPHMDGLIIRVWITDTDMGGRWRESWMDRKEEEEKRIQEGGYSGASLAPGMERSQNRPI